MPDGRGLRLHRDRQRRGGAVAGGAAGRGRPAGAGPGGGRRSARSGPAPAGVHALADDYRVPAFHAFASEHPGMSQDYWVRHYADTTRSSAATGATREQHDGVLYPRVRGLGGCTAHHAMIVVRPNDSDWNHIGELTGDDSWSAQRMQTLLGADRAVPIPLFPLALAGARSPASIRRAMAGAGWMTTERALPLRSLLDRRLWRGLLHSIRAAADGFGLGGIDWESYAARPERHRRVEPRRLRRPHAAAVDPPPRAASARASGCSMCRSDIPTA